jgi:AraC family transcriptional regulator
MPANTTASSFSDQPSLEAKPSGWPGGRRERRWPRFSATVLTLRPDGESFAHDLGGPGVRLAVILEAVGGRVRFRVPAGGRPAGDSDKSMVLAPAQASVTLTGQGARYLKLLVVALEPDSDLVVSSAVSCSVTTAFFDQRLLHLANVLEAEVRNGDVDCDVMGEALGAAIVQTLLRRDRAAPPLRRGGLTPKQLRQVHELIAADLAGKIPLPALARICSVSQSYFCRAFKASTGVSAHQYQLNLRIEAAFAMLLDAETSLAQIAMAVGFADQAHFTRTFGRIAGVSPGAWRREHAEATGAGMRQMAG